jgi:hypothetical protein
MVFVSGPIAKEIGMNAKHNALDVGNQANMTIGRSGAIMTIALGGCITGVVRSDSGGPMRENCYAEDSDMLPPGWRGFNEESGYKKTESVIGKHGNVNGIFAKEYAPSSFRSLIDSGTGGMARRLGIEVNGVGIPGPHNFLEYVIPNTIPQAANCAEGARMMCMHPTMAKSLYDYGFKDKKDVYQWMWDTYFVTKAVFYNYGWYDHRTAGGANIESVSGKPYKDLPDDYLIHVCGTSGPFNNCIVVAVEGADEVCWQYAGAGRPSAYPVDVWK